MSSPTKKTREPLFHVVARKNLPLWKQIVFRIAAILLALAFSSLLIVIMTGLNPIEVYKTMFSSSFGSTRKIWTMLEKTAILLCISLAVTPAFKMRFWNLGAEGQVLAGGLACAACMFYIQNSLPSWLLILIMLVCSVAAGMLWSFLPGFFKSRWGTNETLFTLMMNYIAMQLVTFTIAKWVPTGSGTLNILNADTRCGWLPAVNIAGTDQKYFINVLVVFILTILMYVYLKFTKQGYEIAVVGESVNTANYVGINVRKVIIRTVLISGAICGITGFLLVAGDGHTVSTGIASGNGFTAILVSWLSKFNPLIMILSSFLIVFMQRGASGIASTFNMDNSIADIITAIILFFIIGVEFFINYQIVWTSRTGKEAEG